MGIAVPIGEAQVTLRWLSSGDPEEMVTTFGISGLGPFADASAAAASITALAIGTVTGASVMAQNWVFKGSTVARKQDGGGFEIGEGPATVVGTASVQSLTSNTALLVRKRTASFGRRATGRMFVPGCLLGEALVNNNGFIDTGQIAAQQARWDDFLADLNTALVDDEMVLFHSLGGTSGTEVLPSDPITALVVDPQVATQRRRMRH